VPVELYADRTAAEAALRALADARRISIAIQYGAVLIFHIATHNLYVMRVYLCSNSTRKTVENHPFCSRSEQYIGSRFHQTNYFQ
jgi:hypothetical protein